MASIAGLDDRVLAMIYAHTEPAPRHPRTSVQVISLEGEFDHDAAPYLDRALANALDRGRTVCCDLSRATFFGTPAAMVILDAAQHARQIDAVFVLRGVHGMAEGVLDSIGFDHRIFNQPNAQ